MRSWKVICCCALLLTAANPMTLLAQNDPSDLNLDLLAGRLSASAPADTLSESEKAEVRDTLALATQQLEITQARAQRVAGYAEATSDADATLAELAGEIAALDASPTATAVLEAEDATRSALDLLVAERSSTEGALEELRNAQTTLAARGPFIVSEISAIRTELPTLESAAATGRDAPPGSLAYAQQSLALTRLLDRRRALTDSQLELNTIPARQLIIAQRVLLAEMRAAHLVVRIDILTGHLNNTRAGLAAIALEAAQVSRQSLVGTTALFEAFAEENLALAERLNAMISEQREIERTTAVLREQIAAIGQAHQVVERVVATGRLPEELGVLLRGVRARQLAIAPLEQRVRRNEDSRIAQELNPIIWQERLQRLSDPDAANQLTELGDTDGGDPVAASAEEFATIASLIEQRKTLLAQLISSAQIGRDRLIDEEILLANLINQTRQVTDLLDGRLLWLRNQDPIARDWLANLPASVAWLLDPRAWQGALMNLLQQIVLNPLLALLGFAPALLVLASRKRLLRYTQTLANNVGHVGNDTYWCTPLALAILCLTAAPWPLLMATIAGLLVLGENPDAFTLALIPALLALASLTYLLTLFRMLSQPQGIFAGHFYWSKTAVKKLHFSLFWFTWVQCIATFVFTMAVNSEESANRYSLGLLSFVALSVGMSVMAYAFMNPHNGILVRVTEQMEVATWRKLIFPFLVVIPFLIGVTPLFGYFDTAVLLQSMVFQSGLLLLLVAIFHGLILRMLKIAHRRFSLLQIRQIRAQAKTRRADSVRAGPDADSKDSSTIKAELPERVEQMSQQLKSSLFSATLLLFLGGLWLIWRPLIPAIGIADDLVLWQGTRVIDGVSLSQGITLWNLCVALLFLFGGLYLARNIRGFLEVGLFGRLTLDAGARYAAVSITGYVIVAVTALIGLAQLGIDWSKMQWIVAALGVGLGFGLQEIVANFVSGLIILFERPVRVGDIVTIGELTGTVSKISIRATTVMDFDNREVLLPNKSIITDIVVNWTLNNPVTRIVIKIGVAYGSDLNKAHALLLAIAKAHAQVLETPEPLVFLTGHGDSSIDYEVRVFVSNPVLRWPVTHDLNIAINAAFAENSIHIPFPQRDVHLFNHVSQPVGPMPA